MKSFKQYLNEDDLHVDIARELRRNYRSLGQIPFNKPDTIRSSRLKDLLETSDKYNIESNLTLLLRKVKKYLEVLD